MNRQQFNDALEKLRLAPRKVEVLRFVLAGHTNAKIAQLRGRPEGTIRKQISQLYKDFAIQSQFPGDKPLREELKGLFRQYKPEWISDCTSTITNQVSREGKQENESNKPPLLSPSMQHQDLMPLATRILEQLGFDQKFKLTRAFQYIGYRLKNPEKVTNPYLLILCQGKERLYISIPQYILEPYLLTLKYWVNSEETLEIEEAIAGIFLVLPFKRDIFLDSLHPNYWNVLEVEGKTVGTFFLNEVEKVFYNDFDYYNACSSIPLEEFHPNTLSDSDSYLVLNEDKRFPYTWQVCISSSEVLREFIAYFGKVLIENQCLILEDLPF
jgi:hypothetical protein